MDFEMTKSGKKGQDEITLTITPTDNLEREIFNTLFANGAAVKVDKIPNSESVVIKKVNGSTDKQESRSA